MNFKENIVDLQYSLMNINFNILEDEIDNNIELEFNIKACYQIIEVKDKFINILVEVSSTFEPASKFESVALFNLDCEIKESLELHQIEDNMQTLLMTIGFHNSQIISFLTDKMYQTPFIAPPIIDQIDKKDLTAR